MATNFDRLLTQLNNNRKKVDEYIEQIVDESNKKEKELQEWRSISGCNTLYNFKMKRSNESTLLLENQQWKNGACCGSPGALQKKMTKYLLNTI